MSVKIINEDELVSKIKDGINLVNVFGVWCGPCKMLAPTLEDISKDMPVYKIDVDLNKKFTEEYSINSVPVTMVFEDGILRSQVVGFVPKNHIEKMIKENTNGK